MKIAAIFVVALVASIPSAQAEPSTVTRTSQTALAQVSLQNFSKRAVDLYVDGSFSCHAPPGQICTAQVPAGRHALSAQVGDQKAASDNVAISAFGTYTWTLRATRS